MLYRVVRAAQGALEAEPVVCGLALGGAVVARDDGARVEVLGRHGLAEDGHVVVAELGVHVDAALAAEGALVRRLHVLVETRLVDAVAALHEDDRLGRVEEVVAADGTVAVDRPLDALVPAGQRDARHAFLPLLVADPTARVLGTRLTLQWKKSLPRPCPTRHSPQSLQW